MTEQQTEAPLIFEVSAKGTFTSRLEQPPDAPAMLSPVVRSRSQAAVKYDEMRRPQAAVLFRALKAAPVLGLSWKECWVLGEGNQEWDVGPIVIWMRTKGVEVDARYDPVAGETRFYIV
jgi:hypothetical protein